MDKELLELLKLGLEYLEEVIVDHKTTYGDRTPRNKVILKIMNQEKERFEKKIKELEQ